MQTPISASHSLIAGPYLKVDCCISVGATRRSCSLDAVCFSIGQLVDVSVFCIAPYTDKFGVRFNFKRVSGTLSMMSAGSSLRLHVKPFDFLSLSTKNFPCVMSLDSSSCGLNVSARILAASC